MKFYIEISGRASGKTYKMSKDIIEHLNKYPDSNIGIAAPSEKQYNDIKNHLIILGHNVDKVYFIDKNENIIPELYSKIYFEEFDFIDWLSVEDIKSVVRHTETYWVTTPKKIRSVFDYNFEDDNLLELLQLNGGKYFSFSMFASNIIYDKEVLKRMFEGLSEENFRKEYIGIFLK